MLKKLAIGIGIVAACCCSPASPPRSDRCQPLQAGVGAHGRRRNRPQADDRWPVVVAAVSAPRGRAPEKRAVRAGWDGAFASLSSASVAVAWLPLLTGRIVIDQVNVDGLQAALERRGDGRSNIDDLLQRQKAAPKASSDSESSAISVSIRGISLNDANLSLRLPTATRSSCRN